MLIGPPGQVALWADIEPLLSDSDREAALWPNCGCVVVRPPWLLPNGKALEN